jgi:N-acetylmuramoyl-L-alanine amidase
MKSLSVPLLLLLGWSLFANAARADFINGHSYVSLGAWARANGFGGYTLNSGSQFVLTNKTSRLVFNQDSADSTINGTGVRLSYPVAKGGFLSQLDAEKTVRPLIFPQRPFGKKITTICVDPGHGGKDTGNRVGLFFPRYEKTYTLALALELRRQLQQAGFRVVLTREKDDYVDLATRANIANRANADLFLCLHFNNSTMDRESVQGPETYSMTPVGAASSNDSAGDGAGSHAYPGNRVEDKSLLLAYQVQRSLVRSLGVTDRSVRRARWQVLRETEMPGILLEGGYMSQSAEARRIFDAGWRKQMAAALVRAVVNYQKLTAPPVASPAAVAATNANKTPRRRK